MKPSPTLTFEELNTLERFVWRMGVSGSQKAKHPYKDDLSLPLPDPNTCFTSLKELLDYFIEIEDPGIDEEMEYQFYDAYESVVNINIFNFISGRGLKIMALINKYRKALKDWQS